MLRIVACWLLLALTVAVPAAQAEGELVKVNGQDPVYRIVGGAPLHLGTCAYTPNQNCQPLNILSDLSAYRQYPSDHTVARNFDNGEVFRFAGGAPLWVGRCDYGDRCPYQQVDWVSVSPSEHAREFPADGTVIRNVDNGAYYRFAGGSPQAIRCDYASGCTDATLIDRGVFDYNGSPGGRRSMLTYPADGTLVQNVDTGGLY